MNISGDEGFFSCQQTVRGCESHCFHFAQCILFPEKNTFSERSRLKAEKSYEWFSYCFDRYRCTWRWLPLLRTLACKEMGNRPNVKTPAYTHEDGEDYVPSSKFTVFSHQFSSIAGAGPVTGPILASVFGGFRYCSGSSSADFSSVLYRTSVLYMIRKK